ncbi:MAG: metal ABC transporter permease [Lactobacillaceae bacterium]|jgi:iron/zinc/copper transport system permease protein|nr:metal ABC transporter permease [Lactobacillaceae bacterium]
MITSLINFINGIGQYDFLQNALISGLIIGIVAGVVGSFSILQGTSLIGDAMSHAVLPGIAIASILGIPFYIGAGFFGLLAAAIIYLISENLPLKSDTAIGITFSSFFAVGTIIMTLDHSTTRLTDILFGNILVVTRTDMISTLIISTLVLAFIFIFYRELYVVTFDKTYAKSQGINSNLFRQLLILMLSLVIIVALQAVGVILVTALLITPAAAARMFSKRLSTMIFLSAIIGVISAVFGLYFSYTFGIPSGPSIVVVSALIFVVSTIFYQIKRVISK